MASIFMCCVLCVLSFCGAFSHLTQGDLPIRRRVHDLYLSEKRSRHYHLPAHNKPSMLHLQPNFHEQFALPSGERSIYRQTRLANLHLGFIKTLCNRTGHNARELLKRPDWQAAIQEEFRNDCNDIHSEITCNPYVRYRSINGSCNNLHHPTWGMAKTPQKRYMDPLYDDGIDAPRQSGRNGWPLPSARDVSNIVHRTGRGTPHHPYMSVMVMQWGQFLDHDIVGTPVLKKANGSSYECCGKDRNFSGCIPIPIREDDPHFDSTCMNLVRSSPAIGPDCFTRVRQQMNKVTSYIDGSAVYGSTEEEEDRLRLRQRGLLKVGRHGLLPPSGKDDCIKVTERDFCQTAGDDRPNVVPSIGAIHTLFMQEHNRIAERLGNINTKWPEEIVYQETRKIMAAILQHITYNEYIPLILGERLMSHYGILSHERKYNQVYNESVNAGIANVFAVAAFRFGHSQIPAIQTYVGPESRYRKDFLIQDTYHRPFYLQHENGQGFHDVIRWLISDPQPETDRQLEPGVRDFLFLRNNVSLDLAAINIQRSRDHGIPGYNAWRRLCGFPVASHFGIGNGGLVHHTYVNARLLRRAYRSPDDIDLFSGAISEKHVLGANVGPTFACILGRQFRDLKYGDRFWYQTADQRIGFTSRQLLSIKDMRLSKIVCENLEIKLIQRNVFLTPSNRGRNRDLVPCSDLPDYDFGAWTDISQTKSVQRRFNPAGWFQSGRVLRFSG